MRKIKISNIIMLTIAGIIMIIEIRNTEKVFR